MTVDFRQLLVKLGALHDTQDKITQIRSVSLVFDGSDPVFGDIQLHGEL